MVTDRAPRLTRVERDGLAWFADPSAKAEAGIVVAFSTRLGGVSGPPFSDLNLASHTGDDPAAVDDNRRRLVTALDLDPGGLVTAEQVHGDRVTVVAAADAGRGAEACGGREPIPDTDAMLTSEHGVPLMMMFADCVPVILVARGPLRSVAVVHAGWRGALCSLPGKAARVLATHAGCRTGDLDAYIGPHIGPCHYEVDHGLARTFDERFSAVSHSASIAAAEPRVDLGAAVWQALIAAGMLPGRITKLGTCTAEHLALFYSYRAEGRTGRHGAIAAIRPLS